MRLITDIFQFCAARSAELEHDLDLRLSHPRSRFDRRAGSGLHAGERHRLCGSRARGRAAGGRFRRAALVLLQRSQQPARRSCQVPRRAPHVGKDHARTLQGAEAVQLAVALPHPDRRFHADRPAAREQRGARHACRRSPPSWAGRRSLHTNSMDEALWLPTEKAVRVALRTQQIIAYESGVADSVDPLAGSYLIEHLTDEIENRRQRLHRQDRRYGRRACRPSRTATCRTRSRMLPTPRSRRSSAGSRSSLGVNQFQVQEELTLERLRVDPAIEMGQKAKLKELRENRDERLAVTVA